MEKEKQKAKNNGKYENETSQSIHAENITLNTNEVCII